MIITGQAISTRQRLAVSALGPPPRHLELSKEISKTAAGILRSPSPSQLSSYILYIGCLPFRLRVALFVLACSAVMQAGHAGKGGRAAEPRYRLRRKNSRETDS